MAPDERNVYRYALTSGEVLEVQVKSPDGTIYQGEPLDISIDGIGVRFSCGEPPPLVVGHHVILSFMSPNFPKPVEVEAQIVDRRESVGFSRYRFQYVDADELKRQLPKHVFKQFNRRQSYRVKPDPDKPVDVTLSPKESTQVICIDEDVKPHLGSGEQDIIGRLLDISVCGAGVLVDQSAEAVFAAISQSTLSFTLPPSRNLIEVEAWIRYRRAAGKFVHYGLEFVDSDHHEIIDFVMRRQRENLRQETR